MELPKTALPIKKTAKHWIDTDGSIYTIDKRTKKLIKKAQSTCQGYKYCGIRYENEEYNRSKRVHRLVAETFIPNPHHYNIVGHRNNIKSDNRVENLYWTTTRENTQKAFNDGLIKNDKGFMDSQSKPVVMFDTYTNKKIAIFGSIKEAAQKTEMAASTISRQAKYKRPVRKPVYFRYADDIDVVSPSVIGMFDFKTDKLIQTFINTTDAFKKTNISQRTICQQVSNNKKPLQKHSDVYFKRLVVNKCEQTIEILVGE